MVMSVTGFITCYGSSKEESELETLKEFSEQIIFKGKRVDELTQ